MLLEKLFEPVVRDELGEALTEAPTLLTAQPGIDAGRLAVVAAGRPAVFLDPRYAGTEASLRIDLARAALRALLGREHDMGSPTRLDAGARIRLAEAFGAQAAAVINLAGGAVEEDLSFDEILRGLPSNALLVVEHAHLLAQPWAGRALWSLRGRAEDRDGLQLALVTRPWHTDLLLGADAAFFGFARQVEITPPGPAQWARALASLNRPVAPADLEWLLERADGNVDAALDAFASDGRNVRRGWRNVVGARGQVVELALSAASAIHPLGPRLLQSVAADRAPYSAVPAKPARIAHALRILRDADLIYQPAPRLWRLADPALSEALRRRERHRRDADDVPVQPARDAGEGTPAQELSAGAQPTPATPK